MQRSWMMAVAASMHFAAGIQRTRGTYWLEKLARLPLLLHSSDAGRIAAPGPVLAGYSHSQRVMGKCHIYVQWDLLASILVT